jgi:hypothetical protein
MRGSYVESSEMDSARLGSTTEDKFKVHMMQIDEKVQEVMVTEQEIEAYNTLNREPPIPVLQVDVITEGVTL